jgi:hypothetical protein
MLRLFSPASRDVQTIRVSDLWYFVLSSFSFARDIYARSCSGAVSDEGGSGGDSDLSICLTRQEAGRLRIY